MLPLLGLIAAVLYNSLYALDECYMGQSPEQRTFAHRLNVHTLNNSVTSGLLIAVVPSSSATMT